MRIINCPFCKNRNKWFFSIEDFSDHFNSLHSQSNKWDQRWDN